MSSRKIQHDKIINDFLQIAPTTEDVAEYVLQKTSWNLETALNEFFSNESYQNMSSIGGQKEKKRKVAGTKNESNQKLLSLFEKFSTDESENGEKVIGGGGLEQLCQEMEIGDDDVSLFLFAWCCDCKTFGQFTKEEFVQGMKKVRAESAAELKEKMRELEKEIQSSKRFKDFYRFLWDYLRSSDQKYLDTETAIFIWGIVLPSRMKYLDSWCKFVQENCKSVTKDVWMQLFEFCGLSHSDFSQYDPMDAWPTLIDDFMEKLAIEYPVTKRAK